MKAALLGAAGAAAAWAGVQLQAEHLGSWNRPSFSGRTVSLTEGIVAGAGMMTGTLALPTPANAGSATAIGAAWAAGYVDDHMEARFPAQGKGFHGHLGALREGKLTSGVVKIGLIGAGAALGTLALPRRGSWFARTLTWGGQAALVAGTANLANLLDLRPGRALKAASAAALPLALSRNSVSGSLAATAIGTSAVCARSDLVGETMLGDTGANAIGAGLGMALAASPSAAVRWGSLAAIVGLNAASERVSFSKVIENNRILRAIDEFGRR